MSWYGGVLGYRQCSDIWPLGDCGLDGYVALRLGYRLRLTIRLRGYWELPGKEGWTRNALGFTPPSLRRFLHPYCGLRVERSFSSWLTSRPEFHNKAHARSLCKNFFRTVCMLVSMRASNEGRLTRIYRQTGMFALRPERPNCGGTVPVWGKHVARWRST